MQGRVDLGVGGRQRVGHLIVVLGLAYHSVLILSLVPHRDCPSGKALAEQNQVEVAAARLQGVDVLNGPYVRLGH